MFDFTLTEDQQQLQSTARKFADEVMSPVAAACDEEHRFPHEVFEQAFELGLINFGVPAEFGGLASLLLVAVVR